MQTNGRRIWVNSGILNKVEEIISFGGMLPCEVFGNVEHIVDMIGINSASLVSSLGSSSTAYFAMYMYR